MALVVLALGCAGQKKALYLHAKAEEYVYVMPPEALWPHVKALVEQQGYSYRADNRQFRLVTEWKESMGSSNMAASWTRYLVEVRRIDATHTRAYFFRNTMSKGGGNTWEVGISGQERHAIHSAQKTRGGATGTAAGNAQLVRDLELEWLLLQRAAPEDAQELREEADKKVR